MATTFSRPPFRGYGRVYVVVSLVQPGATYRHDATPRYNVLRPLPRYIAAIQRALSPWQDTSARYYVAAKIHLARAATRVAATPQHTRHHCNDGKHRANMEGAHI